MESTRRAFFVSCLIISLCKASSDRHHLRTCKCLPHHPCFPNAGSWDDFNKSIDGQLLHVRPPASPCYTRSPDHSAAKCEAARTRWKDASWRADQVGASQHNLWETYLQYGCPINSEDFRHGTCSQGSVPVLAVNVSRAEHVSQALRFAAKYNLRLVVKNTGHDYLGRSFGKGSLSIWMHNLKIITFHDNFVPDSCVSDPQSPPVSAVTVGAGVQWAEVYKFQDKHNKVVLGGFSPTVSASGGFTQGGGHSILSPTFGLNVDSVLQFEVVTPDGSYCIANRCQNKDLFWALRGGGGGTFGIVLSTTHTAHQTPTQFVGVFILVTYDDTASRRDFLTEFVKLNPALTSAKWGGYFSLSPTSARLTYMQPNGTISGAQEMWRPLIGFAEQYPGLHVENSTITAYPTFYQYFTSTLPILDPFSGLAGVSELLASRLIPSSIVAEEPEEVVSAMEKILTRESNNGTRNALLGLHVAGGAVSQQHDDIAVNPAWRKAMWHMIIQSLFDDGASEAVKAYKFQDITDANRIWRDLAPDSGCYFNEADYNEPNWQNAFFGDNYSRLISIKRKLDPLGLLVCHHCVGSEDWNDDLTCKADH